MKAARPALIAPAELRNQIQLTLANASPQARQAAAVRRPKTATRAMAALRGFRWISPRMAFAMAILLAVAGVVWVSNASRRPRSAFALAALEAHQRRLHNGIPLGIRSSSPQIISAWFQGKVPVHVNLPAVADLPPQQQPYEIEGAGVVPSGSLKLGYIAYRVAGEPVSLLIAPAAGVSLSGRNQVPMKSLVIHYDSAGGFHIVTWAVPKKGVTYALVSKTSMHANQSCIVCHAAPKDRLFMQFLLSQ
ncbi:MAG: hypothetical protein U0Q18_07960 [Bryobacteraceae bacterium]